jgi:uncharacterized membrane protein
MVGTLLRAGVALAAAVVFLGGALYLLRHGAAEPHFAVFRGEPSDLRSLSGIVRDAIDLQSRGVIQLGLLLLIATPIARVAFSLVAFAGERDVVYVIVTAIVLGVLVWGLA